MPEGPETQRSTDHVREVLGLDTKASDCILVNFMWVLHDGKFKFPQEDLTIINKALDLPLLQFCCKGKAYFMELSKGVSIYAHHGMKGRWTFHPTSPRNVHCIFQFRIASTGVIHNLCFENERFGRLEIVDDLTFKWNSLASSVLGSQAITLDEFKSNLRRLGPQKLVRDVLMDQHLVCSGIGNYLIAEIMYYMLYHPGMAVGRLHDEAIQSLYETVKGVVNGFYRGELNKLVYGKRLTHDGHPISKDKMKDGRVLHWVPAIQTLC